MTTSKTITNALAKMESQADSRLFSPEQAEIMAYNKSQISKITNDLIDFKTKLGKSSKNIWQELAFGYTVGSILGFIREAFINREHRKEICEIIGITEEIVDFYYNYAGHAPYVKNDTMVQAKPADIPNLKRLVYEAAIQMKIILQDSDLDIINVDNEKLRNDLQYQRQEDYINNIAKVNAKVNVNNFFK